MFLVSLIWMQSQPLSKTVIVVASLLFVLAIVLLVYFLRKLKASSKTDEDWNLTRSSLFVEPAAEASVADATHATERLATPEPDEPATRQRVSEALDAEPQIIDTPPTIPPEPPAAPEPTAAPPATELSATTPPARDERRTQLFSSSPPPRQAGATEMLSSLPSEPIIAPATDEATPFDAGVWDGLEEAQPPATSAVTHELRSPAAPPLAPPEAAEPPLTARVDQRPPRAAFEPLVVEPIRPPREPFEPPVINPITPREQTALLGTRSEATPATPDRYSPDEPTRAAAEKPSAAESNLYHQSPKPEPTAPL